MIVVNDVSRVDIGFEGDNNAVIVLSEDSSISIEKMPKKRLAEQLLKIIYQLMSAEKHSTFSMHH